MYINGVLVGIFCTLFVEMAMGILCYCISKAIKRASKAVFLDNHSKKNTTVSSAVKHGKESQVAK